MEWWSGLVSPWYVFFFLKGFLEVLVFVFGVVLVFFFCAVMVGLGVVMGWFLFFFLRFAGGFAAVMMVLVRCLFGLLVLGMDVFVSCSSDQLFLAG